MSYETKKADGTGRLQKGWYAYNSGADSMSERDRFLGPWRTERGAASAIEQAESNATDDNPADDILCNLALKAGKTPAMKAARDSHHRIRNYME